MGQDARSRPNLPACPSVPGTVAPPPSQEGHSRLVSWDLDSRVCHSLVA